MIPERADRVMEAVAAAAMLTFAMGLVANAATRDDLGEINRAGDRTSGPCLEKARAKVATLHSEGVEARVTLVRVNRPGLDTPCHAVAEARDERGRWWVLDSLQPGVWTRHELESAGYDFDGARYFRSGCGLPGGAR